MTQFARPSLVAATDDGITLSTKFNGALAALYTNHAGAAAPPSPEKGQVWIDTSQEAGTPNRHEIKVYTGTVWRTTGVLNLTTGEYATAGNLPLAGGTMTGVIRGQDGTAAAPGYAFSGNANMGMYRIGANNIGWTVNGAQRMSLDLTSLSLDLTNLRLGTTAGNQTNVNLERVVVSSGWTQINFRTGTSNRWTMQVSGAESTANAGSNFFLMLQDDTGALVINYLQIGRASRQMGINGAAIGSATVGIRSNDATSVAYDGIEVMNTSTAADAYAGISLRTASGALRAAIRGERPGSSNNGDLGVWTGTGGVLARAATFRANGNLELTGVLDGATGGRLRSLQRGNNIAFGWGSIGALGSGLSYSIDGVAPAIIPYATNATGMTYQGGTGGPTGVSLNGLSFAGDFFGIFVDAISDERIKENIRDTEVDAAALIMSVPVRAFDIKADVAAWQRSVGLSTEQRAIMMSEAQPAPVSIGFVTQELQRRVPESVKTPPAGHTQPEGSPLPDDCQTYSPEALVPYLWRAIQQHQETIAALTSRIAALEGSK